MRKLPLFLSLLLLSCVTIKMSSDSPPVTLYKLDYHAPSAGDSVSGFVLKIRDFSVADDYDRTDLVLVNENGIVRRSASNRWATKPAIAIADVLCRDFLAQGHFGAVFRRTSPVRGDLIVEGYLREFGARKLKDDWIAVIDVDITLFGGGGPGIHHQKNYRMEKKLIEMGYESLAAALSELAQQWSISVRTDVLSSLDQ